MTEFLSDTLHKNITEENYEEAKELPLFLRGMFEIKKCLIGNCEFLIAKPKEKADLSALRNYYRHLIINTGKEVVLFVQRINYYTKDKLIEEGIPFVWENHDVYMPFLGILLNCSENRNVKQCYKISFLTQKLLFTSVYENWKDVNVTEASVRLGVSKISVTRCYDEIQSLDLPFLTIKNRSRFFSIIDDKKEMFNVIKPYLRNPVLSVFKFRKDIESNEKKIYGGISALSIYSDISDNGCPVYAVEKSGMKEIPLNKIKTVFAGETPACIVYETGYIIPFDKEKSVDPLSLSLMLTEEEMNDPRVEKAVNEMLGEYVWGK